MGAGQAPDLKQTRAWIAQARAGDSAAMEALAEAHARLVASVAKRFIGRGAEYEDLYQVGCVGLVKAIQRFDLNFDVQFSTYAVPLIMGEIKRFLRDDGQVKVSRGLKENAQKLRLLEQRLANEWGRNPTIAELASESGMDQGDVILALDAARPVASLDEEQELGKDGQSQARIDRIADERADGEHTVDRIWLQELLEQLEPRERKLIFLRYFEEKTQAETGLILGVSQVQVSRMEGRILRKMRLADSG